MVLNKKYKNQISINNYSYLGPEFNNNEISEIIKKLDKNFKINFEYEKLYSIAAKSLLKKK